MKLTPSCAPAPDGRNFSVSDVDLALYYDRGYCTFRGAFKTDLRRFLQKIGCQYLDTSMAMVLVGDITVTKEAERWSVPLTTE